MKNSEKYIVPINNAEYEKLVEKISCLWDKAKDEALIAVNSQLIITNWQTGQYIVQSSQ